MSDSIFAIALEACGLTPTWERIERLAAMWIEHLKFFVEVSPFRLALWLSENQPWRLE